jgi:hypothetical protein
MAKRSFVPSAGAKRSPQDAQRQAEQIRDDSTITTVVPRSDADPQVWADYCNQARGQAAAAVVEWGRRIQQAHDAYSVHAQRWGRSWEQWCQDNLGITRRHADKMKAIYGAFGKTDENSGLSKTGILPPQTDCLYALAVLHQSHPDQFEVAVAQGRINPAMKRREVEQLRQELLPPKAERPPRPPKTVVPVPADVLARLTQIAQRDNQLVEKVVLAALQEWLDRNESDVIDVSATVLNV